MEIGHYDGVTKNENVLYKHLRHVVIKLKTVEGFNVSYSLCKDKLLS